MTTLSAPKIKLQLQPVLKTIVYSALAGEFVRNTSMKDQDQIGVVQQLVADQLITKLIVRGRYADGRDETYTLSLKPFAQGETVSLTMESGKSFFEMMDVGLAACLQYAADQIKRLRLVPRFEVEWSEKAKANPALVASSARRLNIKGPDRPPPLPAPEYLPTFKASYTPTPYAPPVERYPQTVHTYTAPPPPPVGFVRQTVVEVTAAKDPGVTFTIETMRRV